MKPTVFIGSSAESLPLARAVNENLDRDFDCVTWPHAFPLSSLTLDNLLETVDRFDYGIFVLAPDDNLALRDRNYVAARDNVVFESGLFMGRYGRKSVFLIVPRDVPDLHLPSDFLGLTVADYESGKIMRGMNEAETLDAACNKIRRAIQMTRSHAKLLEFKVSFNRLGGNFPLKIWIEIINKSSVDVLINEIVFLGKGVLRRSDKASTRNRWRAEEYPLSFRRRYPAAETEHHVKRSVLIRDSDKVDTYIGIDPSHTDDEVARAIKTKMLGTLFLSCYWLEDELRHEKIWEPI